MYENRIVKHFRNLYYFLCTFFVYRVTIIEKERNKSMGDGKRLKEILDNKGKSVRWLARETTISPTTLYSIIQKDTGIRYDFALRIANVLDIEVSDVCSDSGLRTV